MKVFVLCLLALVAFCEARPSHGSAENQLQALAEKLEEEFGIEVSADDVAAALENISGFGDSSDASDVIDSSDVSDSTDVSDSSDADEELQQFADLIGEDVEEVKEAIEMLEEALGEEFDEEEVDAFLEEHGEDIVKEMLEATLGMTSEEKEALKDEIVEKVDELLQKPKLVKAILQKLSDEGLLDDVIVSRRRFAKTPVSGGVSADVSGGLTTDMSTDISADVSGGLTTDMSTDISADVSTGMTTDVSTGFTTDVSTGMTTDVSTGLTTDVSADFSGSVDDLTPEDLAEIAEELSEKFGVPVSPDDVIDMLSTATKRSMKKRTLVASSSFSVDDLLDDLEDDDVAALATAVSEKLGMEVTVADVEEFLEDNADKIEEIIVLAAEELTSAEFAEFEDLLNHPTLLGDVLVALSDEGLLD